MAVTVSPSPRLWRFVATCTGRIVTCIVPEVRPARISSGLRQGRKLTSEASAAKAPTATAWASVIEGPAGGPDRSSRAGLARVSAGAASAAAAVARNHRRPKSPIACIRSWLATALAAPGRGKFVLAQTAA